MTVLEEIYNSDSMNDDLTEIKLKNLQFLKFYNINL